MEDLAVTLTLEIEERTSIEAIKPILTENHYYNFHSTVKIGSATSKRVTSNTIFICTKKIQRTEISHLDKIGEDLEKMRIGILKVMNRCYDEIPTDTRKKLGYELLHTTIIGLTTLSTVVIINLAHPNTFHWLENLAMVGFPVGLDALYTVIRVFKIK